MRTIVVVSVIALALASAGVLFASIKKNRTVPREIVELYASWRQEHNKLYATPAESNYRLEVFYDQKLYVDRSNEEYEANAKAAGQALSGPMFELNGFGDLTQEEFKAQYTGAKVAPEEYVEEDQATETAALQSSPVDFTEASLGASNLGQTSFQVPIRQQGSCGSCWAFSAVAAAEKMYFDKNRVQVALSQQELVDCETGSNGCSGGFPEKAFGYMQNYGVAGSSAYPYQATQGGCRRSSNSYKFGVVGPGYKSYSQSEANRLAAKWVLASVYVFSSGKFRYVSRTDDIFDGKSAGECGNTIDHAINMFTSSGDVITVFNSWATTWGYNGMKKIRVCSESNLYGGNGRIAHPYGSI